VSRRAIITGASSGIGLALARELTRRGWTVGMLARRVELLEKEASALPGAFGIACDVGDSTGVHRAVREAETRFGGPVDLAIANAGVGIQGHASKFNLSEAEHMFRVNVLGMINLFAAVIPSMVERRSGQFAGVASIAGLRGLPSSAVYSASKAAMQAFLEASRIELAPHGVGVTIVNPGFIATPMTEKNRFKMPFLLQADESARIIADGIERRRRVVEFPLPISLLMRVTRVMPDAIYDRLLRNR
jgi:short-subunit dehydrogenase